MEIVAKILNRLFNKKLQSLRAGEARLFGNAQSINSEIGDYTYVSPNTVIKHCKIGKFCSIASDCIIGESDHPYKFLSTSPIFYHKGNIFGETWTNKDHIEIYDKTIIGNDVWIGAGVFVKSGVKIGDGAIIGAGAVVLKDVEPYQIVGGVPAKRLKLRFSEKLIEKLVKVKWWNWDIQRIKENKMYFVTENEHEILNFLINNE